MIDVEAAAALSTPARKRIGFVTSALLPESETNSSFDFFAVLTSEVLRSLQDKYDIVVRVPTPARLQEVGTAQQGLLAGFLNSTTDYEGVIISPADVDAIAKEVMKCLKGNAVPMVTIDQSLESSTLLAANKVRVPSVVPDNHNGGVLAADSLWRYFGTFSNPPNRPKFIVLLGTGVSPMRCEGFKWRISALSRKAIVVVSDPLPFSRDNANRWVYEQLSTKTNAWNDVVGVFACNDELALGVCDAFDRKTLDSGSQLLIRAAVVGFDGIRDVTRRLEIRNERWLLNTVKVPINQMAINLALIVDSMLATTPGKLPTSSITPCDLFRTVKTQRTATEFEETRRSWSRATRVKLRPEVVVITIKDEEERAILKHLGKVIPHEGEQRSYKVGKVRRIDGADLKIAVVRLPEQGVMQAQDTARDAIEDLDPKLIALVGIGGGIPREEYNLGDVIVCTRLHDFSVGAHIENPKTGQTRTQVTDVGGSMEKSVLDLITALGGLDSKLNGWASLTVSQPAVDLKEESFYGPEDFMTNTKQIFHKRFDNGTAGAPRTRPKLVPGSIAASGYLVKDTETVTTWLESARDITAIEMELPGVYMAANRKNGRYPILAVRGLSDVVGFKRNADWTNYACETAAYFFFQILKQHPNLNPRDRFFSSPARS